MNRKHSLFTRRFALCSVALLAVAPYVAWAAEDTPQRSHRDVIYSRKYGMALTMDVFAPEKNKNGLGVIVVASLGWGSSHEVIDGFPVADLLNRGYTVFAVVHSSRPKFTIPEISEDLSRAVQYIRLHAKDYDIDPDHIGVTGISSGGHLALLLGTTGRDGDPKSSDVLARVSSRVQAVACFFPPTDFLNYEEPGKDALGRGILARYKAAFDFEEYDPEQRAFRRITDEEKMKELGRQISPITHVTADDAPTLIIHGDADMLVPIRQSETFIERMKGAGVTAKLVVKPGAGHKWDGWEGDMPIIADWFDLQLKKPHGE